MEKSLKKENNEILKKSLTQDNEPKVSNPIGKNPAPKSIKKSVPKSNDSDLIAKFNSYSQSKTANKMYSGYLSNSLSLSKTINYTDLFQSLYNSFKGKTTQVDLFNALHKVFIDKLNCSFTAYGIFQEKSKSINIKLMTSTGESYSSKMLRSDLSNPVMKCFNCSKSAVLKDNHFLKIPYLKNSSAVLLPLTSVGKTVGVMILGSDNPDYNIEMLEFISNYIGMFVNNIELFEKTSLYANTDTLTGLYNHRGFQEILASEINKAGQNNTELSIIMFDVNNISKINRELGHAKGDEVIKLLGEKVKQNMRSEDKAGRFGSDEVALILPNTSTSDAKYLAEFITYSLSCCFVDDVGPVKVSVGVSTYPQTATNQEKLLILTEQAVYISKARGYKEGMSAIVSTEDFNFWDKESLNSFAEVVAKRHAQLGVNFEEELLHQFNSEEIISQNHLMELANSLAGAIDAKDPYTKGHSTSVSRYSEALARAVNLPEDEVQRITLGALLHDVGKIGIPETVLKKPGKLEDDEWEIMKQHPVIGAEKVLMPNEALRDLIPIVKYHHEHLDGSGYPEKLKGDEIPYSARIVAVADTYHALISDRPYRKGMSIEKACEILNDGAGKLWDKDLVRHFIAIAPSLATIV